MLAPLNTQNTIEKYTQVILNGGLEKYLTLFNTKNDIYLFLGTTKQWHMRRANNPFVIIGVFYPLKESQLSLDI